MPRDYKQELENAIYTLRTKAEDEYYRNTPPDMRGLGVGLQNTYNRYGLDHTGHRLASSGARGIIYSDDYEEDY